MTNVKKRRSILGGTHVEPGTYLTTVIPFDREQQTSLSVEHLQTLNKILNAINDDSSQVPELLTNYILKSSLPMLTRTNANLFNNIIVHCLYIYVSVLFFVLW